VHSSAIKGKIAIMSHDRDALSEFAHLRDVAVQVAQLIADVRMYLTSSSSNDTLELEARLGRLTKDGFDSDIGQVAFCSILQLLESYPRWSRVSPWQEIQDVFYTVDLPKECEGGDTSASTRTQIRTTVGVDAAGDIQIVHHSKQRLRAVDMEMRLMDSESCSFSITRDPSVDGFDVRVAASLERLIPAELLPIAVSPDMVRIKQRKRFFLSSLGVDNETFSFDLSIIYSGKTKSEAEQKQSHPKAPSFEVEIECLQPREYLKSSGGEDIMLALSLILKCLDFSSALNPGSSVTYVPVRK
jgi:hypothetical protein